MLAGGENRIAGSYGDSSEDAKRCIFRPGLGRSGMCTARFEGKELNGC
jgi:hypothetical protein